MIVFVIYFLLITFFIYRNGFFGLLKDPVLSARFYVLAFIMKVSALLVFYLVYTKVYGTVYYSDTQNFFHDSQILYSVYEWSPGEFVKLVVGLQNDAEDTELFRNYLRFTSVWDEDKGEILYNDNRLMLRVHALLHFISGHNYYIHALFSSFAAFIGINWMYQALKNKFHGKEILLFSIWLLYPGIWFWTSSLFKEGPALLLMGMIFISVKRVFEDKIYSVKNILMLLVSAVMALVFKQYTLLPVFTFTFVFYFLKYIGYFKKYFSFVFLFVTVMLISLFSMFVKSIKGKGVIEVLAERQALFIDMSHGGIFLLDSNRFIRLPYDTTHITKTRVVDSEETYVKIKAGVSYSYAVHSHQQDTLICQNNTDTLSEYLLYYVVPKANAAIDVRPLGTTLVSFIASFPEVLYITLMKPLFFDARNTMDAMASFENALVLIALILFVFLVMRHKSYNEVYVLWISIALGVLIIIGITSPNIGAIERYKSLVMPFLIICALCAGKIADPGFLNKLLKKH